VTQAAKPEGALVPLADLPDPGGVRVDLNDAESLILCRRGEAVTGFVNRCPHARWPLEGPDGVVRFTPEGWLLCTAHGAMFDAGTGDCRGGPGSGRGLTQVAVAVLDGWVVLGG
jgi:nitrite reductase/ring-hydroxylating ferredoxin subunit